MINGSRHFKRFLLAFVSHHEEDGASGSLSRDARPPEVTVVFSASCQSFRHTDGIGLASQMIASVYVFPTTFSAKVDAVPNATGSG